MDFSLVSKNGNLSTIFVKKADSVLYVPSSPQIVLEIGSSPEFTFLVYGLSVKLRIVPPNEKSSEIR